MDPVYFDQTTLTPAVEKVTTPWDAVFGPDTVTEPTGTSSAPFVEPFRCSDPVTVTPATSLYLASTRVDKPLEALPPASPPIGSPAAISVASASWTVVVATDSVRPRTPDVLGASGAAATDAGIRGTPAKYGCAGAQRVGGVPPESHSCTAFSAHPDGSVVSTLWPTPGTTSRCPCGKSETTEAAFAVGVRMSIEPEMAMTG